MADDAAMDTRKVEDLSFKEASVELEQIVRSLEAGDLELEESLERYSDRLQPRDGDDADKMRIFKDTMVEGLRDTLTLLNGLNVFGDANLSQICAEVSSRVASIDAGALRSSPATAVSVKMDVDEILRRMKAFQN